MTSFTVLFYYLIGVNVLMGLAMVGVLFYIGYNLLTEGQLGAPRVRSNKESSDDNVS